MGICINYHWLTWVYNRQACPAWQTCPFSSFHPLIGNGLGVGENGSPTPYITTRHVSGPITS